MTERSNPFSSRRRVNAPHDPPVARKRKQWTPPADDAEADYQEWRQKIAEEIWGRP